MWLRLRLQSGRSPGRRRDTRCQWLADVDDAHHSLVLVVQDVAVVHGAAREVLEVDPDPHRSVGGYVDDVTPDGRARCWTLLLDDLHRPDMQIVEEQGQTPGPPVWRDVVNIPANGQVRVRINFKDFTGRSVYHCHILDHEDQGMMGVIEVR